MPHTIPSALRPPRTFGDHPAYVEDGDRAVLRRPARTGSKRPPRATSPGAWAAATES